MGLFSDTKRRKRSLKYYCVSNGVIISRHYTKRECDKACKGVSGGRCVSINGKAKKVGQKLSSTRRISKKRR